jgi:hypothetical protein
VEALPTNIAFMKKVKRAVDSVSRRPTVDAVDQRTRKHTLFPHAVLGAKFVALKTAITITLVTFVSETTPLISANKARRQPLRARGSNYQL